MQIDQDRSDQDWRISHLADETQKARYRCASQQVYDDQQIQPAKL